MRLGWSVAGICLALASLTSCSDGEAAAGRDGGARNATEDDPSGEATGSGGSASGGAGLGGTGPGKLREPTGERPAPGPAANLFVMQGLVGRSTVSCDDGRTWHFNRSDEAGSVCDDMDCSHHSGSAKGLATGEGVILSTWGWGRPGGGLYASVDGATWERLTEDTTFSGVAMGDGVSLAGSYRGSLRRQGDGEWSEHGKLPFRDGVSHARHVTYLPWTKLFAITGGTKGENDVVFSEDARTWWRPDQLPDGCAASTVGIGANARTMIIVGNDSGPWAANVCVSEDRAKTWRYIPEVTSSKARAFVQVDDEYQFYSGNSRYRSRDGVDWKKEALSPAMSIKVVGYNPATGTYVSASDAYEDQQFYRSADGLNWEALPGEAFRRSHSIRSIVAAHAQVPEDCPTK